MADNIALSWSGGKDSALALERLIYNGQYVVKALFTSYNKVNGKINLHNVPLELIRRQAQNLGLPLVEIALQPNAPNAEYEQAHISTYQKMLEEDITHVAFGDIFLEEIKQYRIKVTEAAGMQTYFPLWAENCTELANEFIERGFKAVITAVDAEKLTSDFLGGNYDENFISSLPEDVNVCGENGEFHTFVYDGPIFNKAVKYFEGDVYMEDYRPKINMQMYFLNLRG